MTDQLTTPPERLQPAINALVGLPPIYAETPTLAAVAIVRVWSAADPTQPATSDETSIFTLIPSAEDAGLRFALATDTANQVLDSVLAKHINDFGIEYTSEVVAHFMAKNAAE